MGLFCVNVHFRTTDDRSLAAAVSRRGVTQYRLLPAKDGWISLYEERASQQDDKWIGELAGGLTEDLHVPAIAFLVHDSDIACYWLFDNGRLLDQYNSCPDYFDADATGDEATPSGGSPEVLLRYCRSGVRLEELAAALAEETVFAEGVIERLAKALGIDVQRALSDYRDVGDDDQDESDDEGNGGLDDDDVDDDGGPDVLPMRAGLAGKLAEMLGGGPRGAPADPQVAALVEAAARGDLDEMDRLLGEGVAIDSEAPAPLPGGQPMAGLGQLFPGGAPKIAMTPLLAAIANKQRRAAERLLDGGADPNSVHPLFGTPVHAAIGAGEVDLLQLLLDRGGDVNTRNAQGQTPLQVIAAGRATLDRLAQVRALMESMGRTAQLPAEQLLSNMTLPTEGWDACEPLLKAHGAR